MLIFFSILFIFRTTYFLNKKIRKLHGKFKFKMFHKLNGSNPVVLPEINFGGPRMNLQRCRSTQDLRNFDKDPVLIYVSSQDKDPFWIIEKDHHTKHLKICDVNCVFTHDEPTKYSPDVFVSYLKRNTFKKHCRHQKSMYYSMENFRHQNFDIYATTNSNSDVYSTYLGHFDLMIPPVKKTKKSMASAYISNCDDKFNRLEIINKLRKIGVTIDLFGKCSSNPEPYFSKNLTRDERKIENIKHYKFHLAFENSHAKGYITEKYWQSLHAGTVPVYLGALDIKRYEPRENSILRFQDFKSIEDLAKKMIEIDQNDEKYQKMLEWKTIGPSENFLATIDHSCVLNFCYWCHKIADKYDSSDEWMNPNEKFILFVREIGMFRHYPIQLKEMKLKSLHESILFQFKNYKPRWWNCITKGYRKNLKNREIIKIFKIVKSGQLYEDLTFGSSIDSDEKVLGLKSGSKLDIVFV
jgi:glycoprotein 3-alpha-L-fucosyltransferase